MKLSVIIVSWNTRELLRSCLASLQPEIVDIESEVFLIDNDSHDGSAAMAKSDFAWVNVIANDSNRGFAAANNQALAIAKGEYILLLNPDTQVIPGAIKTMMRFFDQHEKAGIVAPQLLNSDKTIQRSCRQFPTLWNMSAELIGLSRMFPNQPAFRQYKMLDFDHNVECQVDQPQGACLMLKRSVIDQIGFLDEGFFMLFEEVDWCYRIKKAGWQIWFTPKAQIIHHYGQSIKQVKARMIISSHKGFYRFWQKHYGQGRWYLGWLIYSGLMILAALRILAYKLRTIVQPSAA